MTRSSRARESDYYSGLAPGYDELHREEQERKIRLIIEHFPISPEESLLDVGCGTGFSLALWPTAKVTGVEPSAAMIAQAPSPLQKRILNLRAEDLSSIPDHKFDVVVSITAVHNFASIETGLRELRRVGRKKFVFSVLKKSAKLGEIDRSVRKLFKVKGVLDDVHDRIYLIY
jgi:ubiquinone/menaquinone biosynthesis C-methylase UbiE